MVGKREGSPASSSSTCSSSISGSGSASDDSSSSESSSSASPPPIKAREHHFNQSAARKRQRSPSPKTARRERQHSPQTIVPKQQESRHSYRQSRSPSHRHRDSERDSRHDRGNHYADVKESSRAGSHRGSAITSTRDMDRKQSSRDKAGRSHLADDNRDRRPDHHSQSGEDGKHMQVDLHRTDRRHQQHRKEPDATGHRSTEQNAEKRRLVRSDNQGSARDQTGLPPPPPQPMPSQSQGNERRQPPQANGNPGRQTRWAKEEDKSAEQWGVPGNQPEGKEGKEDKPEPEANFALSGKLAAESNTVKGVVLVHQEPPEARKPSQMWRLYGFKNGEPIDKPLYIHRQTCYLFGRERRVADVPLDHPSISKQHAVMQYRLTEKEGADQMMHSGVRPYLMDLGSANGTYLNNERIEPERYYELLERDMVKFGHSTREYVLLHAQSNA